MATTASEIVLIFFSVLIWLDIELVVVICENILKLRFFLENAEKLFRKISGTARVLHRFPRKRNLFQTLKK